MRKLYIAILFSLVCLLGASAASAQRYDNTVQGPRGPIANAYIAVCTQPANVNVTPCSTLATLYTDATLATPCTGTLVVAPSSPGQPCSNPMLSDALGNYHFYAAQSSTFTVQIYGPQVNPPFPMYDQTVPISSPLNGVTCKNFESIRCVDPINSAGWAGSDPGAWINSAVSNCAGPCIIQMSAGTFLASTAITLTKGITLQGAGNGNITADTPATLLQEANGANLTTFIAATGTGVTIRDIYIDGNKTNNSSAQDCINASNVKFRIMMVTVDNCKRHDLVLGASGQDTRITQSSFVDAGSNNIEISAGATDVFLLSDESENAGQYDLHTNQGTGGIHIIGGDYSNATGSSSDCMLFDGTGSQVYPVQIVAVQVNPCQGNGIAVLDGNAITISTSEFGSVGKGGVSGHTSAVLINSFGNITVTGNVFEDGQVTPTMGKCVDVVAETHSNVINSNKCYINNSSTSLWTVQPADAFLGNRTENNAGTVAIASQGDNVPILTSLTTSAATSDNVTVTGMTSSGHCSLTATNASAATNIATSYISAKAANQITVTHTATASMTYDILCTPN